VNVKSVKLVRLVAPGASAASVGPTVDLAVYQGPTSDSGALSATTRAVVSPAVVGDDILALSHATDGGTLAQALSIASANGQPTLQPRTLGIGTSLFTNTTQTVGTTASGGFAYVFTAKGGVVNLALVKPGCGP
jgi:hypothetical protein